MNLKNKLCKSFRHNIPNTMNYCDPPIKSIPLYCSDFGGCLKLPEKNPLEKLNMFSKNILCLKTNH